MTNPIQPYHQTTILEEKVTRKLDTIRVLAPGMAERLAELYLPVRLRDYWLLAHPLVQAHIFTHSTSPEEFFTNVDMEFSRHVSWKHKFSSQNSWKQEIKMIDSITEVRLLPGE